MIFGGSFLSLPDRSRTLTLQKTNKSEAVTLTLTQRCFSTFLPPVWSGKPQVFSYKPPPYHESSTLNFDLKLPGLLERYQSFGSMSSEAIEAVSFSALPGRPKQSKSLSRHWHRVSIMWPFPLKKLGDATTLNICVLLTFRLHTMRQRTSAPQTWQNQSTEPPLLVLPNAAMLTGQWTWWLKFVFKGLDYTTSTTMRTNALMARS